MLMSAVRPSDRSQDLPTSEVEKDGSQTLDHLRTRLAALKTDSLASPETRLRLAGRPLSFAPTAPVFSSLPPSPKSDPWDHQRMAVASTALPPSEPTTLKPDALAHVRDLSTPTAPIAQAIQKQMQPASSSRVMKHVSAMFAKKDGAAILRAIRSDDHAKLEMLLAQGISAASPIQVSYVHVSGYEESRRYEDVHTWKLYPLEVSRLLGNPFACKILEKNGAPSRTRNQGRLVKKVCDYNYYEPSPPWGKSYSSSRKGVLSICDHQEALTTHLTKVY